MGDRLNEPDARLLAGEVHAAGARLAELVEQTLARSDLTIEDTRQVFAEVSIGVEELRVAGEELLVQSEQILASHRALEAERERYAQLFEFAPDAYLETDTNGKVLEANRAAAAMFGMPVRVLVGKLLPLYIGDADRRMLRNRLNGLAEGADAGEVLVELAPRQGDPAWVDIRMTTFKDAVDGVLRIRWLLRDVTERRKIERELGQLHASVELLGALNTVTHLTEGGDSVQAVLDGVVELARRTTGAEAAAVVLAGARQPIRVGSSEAAIELCDVDLDEGGPMADAARMARPANLSCEALEAWPALSVAARQRGVTAIAAQPIIGPEGSTVGGLALYATEPIDDASRIAELLASAAATAVANAQLYAGARDLADQLAIALESRGVIDQAKGVLMAGQHCSADEAFDLLRRASQRENRKVRSIAEDIVSRVVSPPHGRDS